jgi:hypothetical protein
MSKQTLHWRLQSKGCVGKNNILPMSELYDCLYKVKLFRIDCVRAFTPHQVVVDF